MVNTGKWKNANTFVDYKPASIAQLFCFDHFRSEIVSAKVWISGHPCTETWRNWKPMTSWWNENKLKHQHFFCWWPNIDFRLLSIGWLSVFHPVGSEFVLADLWAFGFLVFQNHTTVEIDTFNAQLTFNDSRSTKEELHDGLIRQWQYGAPTSFKQHYYYSSLTSLFTAPRDAKRRWIDIDHDAIQYLFATIGDQFNMTWG